MFAISEEQYLKYWENSPTFGNMAHFTELNGEIEEAKLFFNSLKCMLFMTTTFILISYRINLPKSTTE